MNTILRECAANPAVSSLIRNEDHLGNVQPMEEALLLSTAFVQTKRSMVIVKNTLYSAQQLYQRLLSLLDDHVQLFAAEDSLRVEAIAASPEMKANQLETMSQLLEEQACILVTHIGALLRYLPKPEVFQSCALHIKIGDEYGFEKLKAQLFQAGYRRVSRIDQPLCYASRGGIVDVYSINHEHPLRIEFFDNEIDSIRYFDISTQRTIETIQNAWIIPATDFLLDNEELREMAEQTQMKLSQLTLKQKASNQLENYINEDLDAITNHQTDGHLYPYFSLLSKHYTILDYTKQPQIIFSSLEELKTSYKHIQEETISYVQELVNEQKMLPLYQLFADLDRITAPYHPMNIGLFVQGVKAVSSQITSISQPNLGFDKIMENILLEAKNMRLLFTLNHHELPQVKQYLNEHNYEWTMLSQEDCIPKGISLLEKELPEGFIMNRENLMVCTAKEIFQVRPRLARYQNKFKEAEVLHNFQELDPGDYVVHNEHGIGKYLGIVNREIDNVHKDFLKIAYKGNDVLFVPLEQFQLIRKFVSKEGAVPKLNKIGSGDWERTKSKIRENIAELAQRLVHLYANREEHIGHAFSKDTVFQKQFEDDFEYELTDDQRRAIAEIKADMELDKPMDRLLCGDVGFGKTEVAIRAAFKAVLDNKQVAFLCPTTILSLQHYQTFLHRFQNYPVKIAVLNRFVTPSDQRKIISDLKKGNVDILIGTHRLLSKDVVFKDLGFLVIDEEQRFGVEHKEKIKELKHSVDVLSLSATPIPRTLQMSLIGIRALSQLDTPPLNRMPVQTYVIEKNFQVIKEIIQRELSRNGQVFYLFNNVKEIYQTARRIQNMLPDVAIGVAHGQMSRDDIEDVMMRFTNNEYHVLVCTTIIETGIDIPNANTILIENADRFGLSQLYQIKGRVGRSDRLAYAYLMYSPQKQLSEIAMKRLKSIKEFTQLGSGYKIAMRDLTIRGAGDMLGPQQAGFIDTIGIDMYIEMLNEAIREEKGLPKAEIRELKKTNAKLDAYIPEQFAPEDYEKLTLYQRMEKITTKQELLSMMDEIADNYGKLPKAVQLLFEKKRLDILVNEEHVEAFRETTQEVIITFDESWSSHVDGVKLFERMTTISKDIKIRYTNQKITVRLPKYKDWLKTVIEILEQTKTPS